ncbi:signal transduction histidine kinase [Flavimobilis soli]|uniref:histidine kinase n=1 Tax=Flavimobilis soli TaxID=442709 RepID=A0A2A9EDR9_9MICO|nr:HAMP domain-containing sensor histidine kinase [Flavimobilis soli]PFG36402.1 signal transduction histidine kinase [Flavimobilis soli]
MTPTGDDAARRRGPWARLRTAIDRTSVRTRVLVTVLTLSAVGMLLAASTALALQTRAADDRMDGDLLLRLEAFTTLAESGTDPSTGRPFGSARDLVYASMRLTVPGPNEGMVGLVGDKVALTAPRSVALRLEDDPQLVAALAGATTAPSASLRTTRTEQRTYRYVVVPVHVVPPAGVPAESVAATHGALVVAYDRDEERSRSTQVFSTLALMSVVALVAVGAIGWFVAGRLLAPIRRLDETARRISESDLTLRIPVTGEDDLARLTATVNAMLDRLEGVFRSQRTLLEDVGHELRTPLTIVRGHLELMDAADPQDAAATREVALSELARMSRLVDDLMTLARIDRPDFVRPTPTDVGRLTDDLLDTLRPLAERRWLVDARADGVADLDEQRITQAVVQLVANAVRHSPDGAVVAIGSETDPDGTWRIWVRDEGEGIALEEQPRIFDRFHRGAARDDSEGSGIGLSIVSAIAAAHGGSVTVRSQPGHGATFTITAPGPAARRPAAGGRDEVDERDNESPRTEGGHDGIDPRH